MTHSVSWSAVRRRALAVGLVITVAACATIEPFGDDLGKALNTIDESATGCTPPTPEAVHCDTKPGRCSIVIAAAADTKRSAVLPYAIAG